MSLLANLARQREIVALLYAGPALTFAEGEALVAELLELGRELGQWSRPTPQLETED